MPTIGELMAQKAAIEQQIAEAQKAERADAVAKVRALMVEHGLTLADLSAKTAAPRKPAPRWRPNIATPPPAIPGRGEACNPSG